MNLTCLNLHQFSSIGQSANGQSAKSQAAKNQSANPVA